MFEISQKGKEEIEGFHLVEAIFTGEKNLPDNIFIKVKFNVNYAQSFLDPPIVANVKKLVNDSSKYMGEAIDCPKISQEISERILSGWEEICVQARKKAIKFTEEV